MHFCADSGLMCGQTRALIGRGCVRLTNGTTDASRGVDRHLRESRDRLSSAAVCTYTDWTPASAQPVT